MKQSFKFPDLHRISLFIGAYGSGKSEISANYAAWLAAAGNPVTLCDLDIINPFFRTSDARAALEPLGIRLISPPFAGTNSDVPALPAEVRSVFDQDHTYGVLDIGGEDLGARVVAALRPHLLKADKAIYMVVNTCRPYTDSISHIIGQARALEQACGFPINGLVQNTNLLEAGDPDLLAASDYLLDEAAGQLDIPVVFAAAISGAVPPTWLSSSRPLLVLERFIRYPGQPG